MSLAIWNVTLFFLVCISSVENSAASFTIPTLKVIFLSSLSLVRISFLSLIFCSVTMMWQDAVFFVFFLLWIEFFLVGILCLMSFISFRIFRHCLFKYCFCFILTLPSFWDSNYKLLWDVPVCLFHLSNVLLFTNPVSSLLLNPSNMVLTLIFKYIKYNI